MNHNDKLRLHWNDYSKNYSSLRAHDNLPIISTLPKCKAVGVKFYIVRPLVEGEVNLQSLLSGKQVRVARIVRHLVLVSTCYIGAHAHAVGGLFHQRKSSLDARFFC